MATITEKNAERKARNEAVIAAYGTFVDKVAAVDLRITCADGIVKTFEITARDHVRSHVVARLAGFLYSLVVDGKIRRKNAKRTEKQQLLQEQELSQPDGGEFTTVHYGKKRYPGDVKQSDMIAYVEDIMDGLFWIDVRGASTALRKEKRLAALEDAVDQVHTICDPFKNEKYDVLMELIHAECAPLLKRL